MTVIGKLVMTEVSQVERRKDLNTNSSKIGIYRRGGEPKRNKKEKERIKTREVIEGGLI